MSLWESEEIGLTSELLSVVPGRTESRSSGLAHWQSAGLSRRPAVVPFPSTELTPGHGWRLLRSRRFHRDENTLLGRRVRGTAFEEACSESVDRGGSSSAHEGTANSTSNWLAHFCLLVRNSGGCFVRRQSGARRARYGSSLAAVTVMACRASHRVRPQGKKLRQRKKSGWFGSKAG